MMIIQVVKKETGEVVAKYPVVVGGQNYSPSAEERRTVAWRNAVSDGVVREEDREKYDLVEAQ